METQRVKNFLPAGESDTASWESWHFILAFENRQKWKREGGERYVSRGKFKNWLTEGEERAQTGKLEDAEGKDELRKTTKQIPISSNLWQTLFLTIGSQAKINQKNRKEELKNSKKS